MGHLYHGYMLNNQRVYLRYSSFLFTHLGQLWYWKCDELSPPKTDMVETKLELDMVEMLN